MIKAKTGGAARLDLPGATKTPRGFGGRGAICASSRAGHWPGCRFCASALTPGFTSGAVNANAPIPRFGAARMSTRAYSWTLRNRLVRAGLNRLLERYFEYRLGDAIGLAIRHDGGGRRSGQRL